jgi:hypothetical protein
MDCPLHWECSKVAWDRQRKCESYESEEESRQFVLGHLRRSDKHVHNKDLYLQEIAAAAEVTEEEVPAWWFEPQPPKRSRRDAPLTPPIPPPPPHPSPVPVASASCNEIAVPIQLFREAVACMDRSQRATSKAIAVLEAAHAAFMEEDEKLKDLKHVAHSRLQRVAK